MHMQVHTGEKPFSCEVCRVGFSQKSTLKKHMKTQRGEKPFSCEVCGSAFSCNSNFKKMFEYTQVGGYFLVKCVEEHFQMIRL